MKKVLIILLNTITIITSLSLYAQNDAELITNPESLKLPNNFHDLEEERLKIISDMYGSMYEISGLFTELERSESLEKLLEEYNIKGVDSMSPERQLYSKRLENIRKKIILPELKTIEGQSMADMQYISVSEGFRRIIENKVQAILKKTDQLSSVGAKVTELNNTSYVSQNFKKQISWSFAFLVGIVIVGFFIIAARDNQIRKSIFTGNAGLQFITIFSIIIAIILFGITEVLGGKEISALIGGISGYILGRSSLQKKEDKPFPVDNVNPQ